MNKYQIISTICIGIAVLFFAWFIYLYAGTWDQILSHKQRFLILYKPGIGIILSSILSQVFNVLSLKK